MEVERMNQFERMQIYDEMAAFVEKKYGYRNKDENQEKVLFISYETSISERFTFLNSFGPECHP